MPIGLRPRHLSSSKQPRFIQENLSTAFDAVASIYVSPRLFLLFAGGLDDRLVLFELVVPSKVLPAHLNPTNKQHFIQEISLGRFYSSLVDCGW